MPADYILSSPRPWIPVDYILTRLWQWIAEQGITLAILLVIAVLIPRIGRFVQRLINDRIEESDDADESKAKLAMVGVLVYVVEMIAYFILIVFLLQTIGFSLAGAAIPATVVSAAIGFGAQSIIADFLAGFFILSEKQYGVGDWVRFEGNGVSVEGTVIQVTMRATRIRTLAHETVIIPNSTARVSINTSNYWSRAVVVIPVPLLGSESPQEAVERSEAATRRALDRPDVASELIGELDVHPAVGVNPPTVVGMPWTVDMRFMIQVKAGSQWLVERAIRTSILAEFWDEYGSATTVTGELLDQVHTADPAESGAGILLPTEERQAERAARADRRDSSVSTGATGTPQAPQDTDAPEVLAAGAVPLGAAGATSATERLGEPGRTEQFPVPKRTDEKASPPEFTDEEGKDPAVIENKVQTAAGEDPDAPESPEEREGDKDDEGTGPTNRWQRLVSVGGRFRPSTTYLFATLFLLLILRGLTLDTGENWEGAGGILAPRDPAPETVQEPESTPDMQEPVPTPTRAPETTTPGGPGVTPTDQGTATAPRETQSPGSPQSPQSPQTGQEPQGTQGTQGTQAPQQEPQQQSPGQTGAPAPTGGTGGGVSPQGAGQEPASTPGNGQNQPLN